MNKLVVSVQTMLGHIGLPIWQVLGLQEDATLAELRFQLKKLMKRYHPDTGNFVPAIWQELMTIRDILNGPPELYMFNMRFGKLSGEDLRAAARDFLTAVASGLVDDAIQDASIPETNLVELGHAGVLAFIRDQRANLCVKRNQQQRELKRASKLLNRVNVPSSEWERALMLNLVKKTNQLKEVAKQLHYEILLRSEVLLLLGDENEQKSR